MPISRVSRYALQSDPAALNLVLSAETDGEDGEESIPELPPARGHIDESSEPEREPAEEPAQRPKRQRRAVEAPAAAEEPKKRPGRPRLTPEEKAERAAARAVEAPAPKKRKAAEAKHKPETTTEIVRALKELKAERQEAIDNVAARYQAKFDRLMAQLNDSLN